MKKNTSLFLFLLLQHHTSNTMQKNPCNSPNTVLAYYAYRTRSAKTTVIDTYQPTREMPITNVVNDPLPTNKIKIISQKKPHSCTKCDKSFDTLNGLNRHRRVHSEKLSCNKCDKKFYQIVTLNIHMRTHTSDKQYECTVCDRSFLQKMDLANHLRSHQIKKNVATTEFALNDNNAFDIYNNQGIDDQYNQNIDDAYFLEWIDELG